MQQSRTVSRFLAHRFVCFDECSRARAPRPVRRRRTALCATAARPPSHKHNRRARRAHQRLRDKQTSPAASNRGNWLRARKKKNSDRHFLHSILISSHRNYMKFHHRHRFDRKRLRKTTKAKQRAPQRIKNGNAPHSELRQEPALLRHTSPACPCRERTHNARACLSFYRRSSLVLFLITGWLLHVPLVQTSTEHGLPSSQSALTMLWLKARQ